MTLQDPHATQPCIMLRQCRDGNPLQSSAMSITMDGQDVVDEEPSMDISLATACLMAVYFVYAVQYPAKLKNTLIFFERFVFGLSNEKVPVTVQRAYNLLRWTFVTSYGTWLTVSFFSYTYMNIPRIWRPPVTFISMSHSSCRQFSLFFLRFFSAGLAAVCFAIHLN